MMLGLGVALLVALPSQAAPRERRFIYAATHDAYAYASVFGKAPTPAGEPAPLGNFYVVPSDARITLVLDDYGSPDGATVPVRVSAAGKRTFSGCLAVRKSTTFGVTRGGPVYVDIGGVANNCTTPGTAGVAVVTGVK